MRFSSFLLVLSVFFLSSCAFNQQGTIADLRDVDIEVKDTTIEGGVEKAMQSYQQFLEQTPETAMTPEAIRRLADLNIEKEYGVISESEINHVPETVTSPDLKSSTSQTSALKASENKNTKLQKQSAGKTETSSQFEKRAAKSPAVTPKGNAAETPLILADGSNLEDLQTAGAKKAIKLYKKLLVKFPLYERNDQVLYQLSRAYEETGQVDEAMKVMNRLVKEYPGSRHFPEVQFRRAEYYFTRKKFLDAEDAYKSLLAIGKGTEYYDLALYKQGWTFYKQELYEDGLHHFIGLLDYKLSTGYDFEQTHNKTEKKRIEDTYRVISLSFSSLGGAEAVIAYFKKFGSKSYESEVYRSLAEFYLTKRRYSDSAKTYKAFIDNNPYNKVSPHFSMRIIEVYHKGGFPRFVIEGKKDFASTYGLKSDYWKYFNVKQNTDVVDYLKKNIIDLANHYHAIYQKPQYRNKRAESFKEAAHWYKEFLLSFPRDDLSPGINYQLADLYLENKDYLSAAIEYEKTAYEYKENKKSSSAGYAAVYAYREYLKKASQYEKIRIKREVIRTSLRFVDVFPKHDKAAIVLSAAVDDLYQMKDYQLAINAAHQLITNYPAIKKELIRSAWLIVAYASFDLKKYNDSEIAYVKVLAFPDKNKKKRRELFENLAAAIYKQGERAVKLIDYKAAAEHFLRVGKLVPKSKIRSAAEYDAATAFIKLKAWGQASEVLISFRKLFPGHKLLSDVTKKMAYIYREDKKYTKAAVEYERIFKETSDKALRRESLQIAADLYEKIPDKVNALRIYKAFVVYFPKPIEEALEIHQKVADIYKADKNRKNYIKTLRKIIKVDASAGKGRTDRTRYLAGMASLAIIDPLYTDFVAIKLVKPFKKNLNKKKKKMKRNIKKYNRLVDYKVGDVTAAATFYIAETYFDFSQSLMKSDRPTKLSDLELEQYELMLEEQAYPFEEKAIRIHKKNIELLSVGIFSSWIDKSLGKLAEMVPGRYAKFEESTGVMNSMLSYHYKVPKITKVPEKTAMDSKPADKEEQSLIEAKVANQ